MSDLGSKREAARKALETSKQSASELDIIEGFVVEKVKMLHRINKENNFSAKLEQWYLYGSAQ